MTTLKNADILNAMGYAGDLAKTITDEDSITRYKQNTLSSRVAARVGSIFGTLLVMLAIGCAVAFVVKSDTFGGIVSVVFLFLFFITGLLRDTGLCLADLLQTLSESGDCAEAMRLVDGSVKAAQWRDLAVADGRALRMFDLEVMRALSIQENKVANEEAHAEICRRLHRVPA